MAGCCATPDPIILGNGHRWCRNCKTDLDAPPKTPAQSRDHEWAADGVSDVPCKWCGVPYADHAKPLGPDQDR